MITDISQLVSKCESNNRLDAIRFEPAYHPDKRAFDFAKQYHPGLSYATYSMLLASSWGLFQIMGDNLMLLGLKCSFLDYWKDSDMQRIYFHKYCASRNIAYTLEEILEDKTKRDHFAKRYNGSVVYADRLLNIYANSKS